MLVAWRRASRSRSRQVPKQSRAPSSAIRVGLVPLTMNAFLRRGACRRLSSTSRSPLAIAREIALRQSAATAFTDWHASQLSERLQDKCKAQTRTDKALLQAAQVFTLQHADMQSCVVGEIV